ncbi:Sda1 family protein [Mycena sanguinolenta]|uniref:Sda1 family protein n=1 Tax=Mycena sanguinolenta TaxID=230812 RepID=A0A8H7CIG6_9AGAR|nr:Sda1 family protein [Mycena sanguinolenta]
MSNLTGLPPAEQASINISLGGVVVSNYLSFLTMGVVCCYTWMYFRNFPNDRWGFKVLVGGCFLMCAADTAGTGIWVYDWAVAGYANPAVLGLVHWAFPVEAMLLGTCSTLVQCFYAWRIWLVSARKNWVLPIVIVCLSLLGWCIVCWMVSIMVAHKLVSDLSLVSPTVYVWLGGSVGADVLITASMIYYLDLRFRTKDTSKVIDRDSRFRAIIRRTVECNVLSLLGQTVSVGLFNAPNVGFYFVLTDMTLAKVYTFSLLISLLGRRSDGRGLSGGRNTTSKSGEQHALSDRRVLERTPRSTQMAISVQRETVEDREEWDKTNEGFDQYQKVRLPNV